MSTGKHTIIYSPTKAKIKDIFEYLGHYPQCDFVFHMVFDDDWSGIPDSNLPLLLWHAGEVFIEDTSKLNRPFVYVTGNALVEDYHYFNIHDIAASKIWDPIQSSRPKTKKFLFLNGKDIGHRRYIYTHMFLNNMLKDSIYTYRTLEDMDWWYDSVLGFSQQDIEYSKLATHTLPFTPFDSTNQIRNLSQDIYHDTYCSIIGESTFQHYRNQIVPLEITEKTYSACANMHMFIIAGAVGILSQLHKQGFETFGDIWDESYDNITNTAQRLKAVCETISYVNTLNMEHVYHKCRERLLHNRNLIYTIDIESRLEKVTQALLNCSK